MNRKSMLKIHGYALTTSRLSFKDIKILKVGIAIIVYKIYHRPI